MEINVDEPGLVQPGRQLPEGLRQSPPQAPPAGLGQLGEAALQALKPASNCEDLDKAANAAGEQVIAKYRKLDADYDRRTDHGRNQGATLL